MTPNDIEVMIHYYGSRSVHPRGNAPAVRDAIVTFLQAGLLVRASEEDVYEPTEGGRLYVEQLCAVPFPVLKWVEGCREGEK